jgi:hypothetical protein
MGGGTNPKRQGFAPDNCGPDQNLRCSQSQVVVELVVAFEKVFWLIRMAECDS